MLGRRYIFGGGARVDRDVVTVWTVGVWGDFSRLKNSLAGSCERDNVIPAEVAAIPERLPSSREFSQFVY
jgi:hypothetical protein